MADVKWIKIPSNFFELEEVKKLEEYTNKDEILVTLLHLITLTNKKTPRNVFKIFKNVIMSDEVISSILEIEISKWIRIKEVLINHNLIEIESDTIHIKDFWKSSRDRGSERYSEWRRKVFERDKYTCQKCGTVGGALNSHHIIRWVDSVKLRYEISNGITLCEKCHRLEHKKGGK